MKALSLRSFADRLATALPRLARQIWHYERDHFTRGEISAPQLWALEFLSRQPDCTMRELAKALRTKESTTTGLVDRMTAQGLVQRVRSRQDRRVVRVASTAKGRGIIREIETHKRRMVMKLFRPLSARDRGQYLEIIEKLVREFSPETTGGRA